MWKKYSLSKETSDDGKEWHYLASLNRARFGDTPHRKTLEEVAADAAKLFPVDVQFFYAYHTEREHTAFRKEMRSLTVERLEGLGKKFAETGIAREHRYCKLVAAQTEEVMWAYLPEELANPGTVMSIYPLRRHWRVVDPYPMYTGAKDTDSTFILSARGTTDFFFEDQVTRLLKADTWCQPADPPES